MYLNSNSALAAFKTIMLIHYDQYIDINSWAALLSQSIIHSLPPLGTSSVSRHCLMSPGDKITLSGKITTIEQ